jgi:CheY-like chemotaxis protein
VIALIFKEACHANASGRSCGGDGGVGRGSCVERGRDQIYDRGGDGGRTCGYVSWEQCRATTGLTDGFCLPNPGRRSAAVEPRRQNEPRRYGASAFASVEDFLQSGRVDDTSCLITDVRMPGMSGVELQSLLIAQGNRTPMIFMTANPVQTIRAVVMQAGAVGVLSKPFKEQNLIDCLNAALNDG